MIFFQSRGIRIIITLIVIFLFGYGYYITRTIPKEYKVGKRFIIEEDESLKSISTRLEKEHYINSALWFRVWVSLLGRDRHVQLGEYIFNRPFVLGAVIKKLVSSPDVPLVSVTIPEGSTSYEVAMIMKKSLPNLSIDIFGEKVFAKKVDGKLFPSTYFLLPSSNEERIVDIMIKTFDKKYTENFEKSKIPMQLEKKDEVIILASILEAEAKTKEDMQIVAGILLLRLKKGVALQVDSAPETYKNRGLPIQSINNPGLISIYSVFHPTITDYFYYLSDINGTIHYAKTFAEHKDNIRKYLR